MSSAACKARSALQHINMSLLHRTKMPAFQACCAHDHDCEASECGLGYALYEHIDTSKVTCLNEQDAGSCKNVFKPWAERLVPTINPLKSHEDDPDLLLHVPFAGAVKLKAICIIGGAAGTAPATMKAYLNRDDLDFAAVADMAPVQEWTLQDNSAGVLEYPTQVTKFNGVHSITLHLAGNFGADYSEVHFVGFKGEFTERKRQAVTAVYEARAMPSDHQVKDEHKAGHQLGM